MNKSFDFKRFGQVLAKDWKDYFRNFGISLIVWSCIPILFWIVTLIFDGNMENGARAVVIASLVFSVLMFVPSKVYGKANLSREGVGFAMLPATSLEKFLSMVFYCSVLTPLIVGLGSWAIDSLLYLLPFGGFTYFFVVLPKSELGLLIISIACSIILFSSIFLFVSSIFSEVLSFRLMRNCISPHKPLDAMTATITVIASVNISLPCDCLLHKRHKNRRVKRLHSVRIVCR